MYIHVFSTLDVNSLEGVLEMQILKTHSDSRIPSSNKNTIMYLLASLKKKM